MPKKICRVVFPSRHPFSLDALDKGRIRRIVLLFGSRGAHGVGRDGGRQVQPVPRIRICRRRTGNPHESFASHWFRTNGGRPGCSAYPSSAWNAHRTHWRFGNDGSFRTFTDGHWFGIGSLWVAGPSRHARRLLVGAMDIGPPRNLTGPVGCIAPGCCIPCAVDALRQASSENRRWRVRLRGGTGAAREAAAFYVDERLVSLLFRRPFVVHRFRRSRLPLLLQRSPFPLLPAAHGFSAEAYTAFRTVIAPFNLFNFSLSIFHFHLILWYNTPIPQGRECSFAPDEDN